ncbi:hypothetical protein VSS74_10290 [Conexibacter stalactiti]|uniref:Stress response protein n=1 Tax=Conexibacter stalactiti TaxID=1940611 RepID=A0ABU4HPV1_9ACTN|nr:hypothetical protein [Conexibacter stalactiti]MDW5594727.1 hypothetical protein [Conexibacter stalactiti]MEC5035369.1 hypothetical protein [Conexibacter stalactiti]
MKTTDALSSRDGWRPARLLPTVGIRGQEEQERRATSALLAVMRAVPEFGHALLKELGAPKSLIQTFAEVRFRTADGKTVIPDGAIVCERGKRSWTCLVEVKTGSAQLRDDQVSSYLDVARDNGFDAVLTISNQITSSSAESPVSVDGRKLKKVALWHFSWWRVITDAIVQSRYRGVSDPDQAWILDELIAYLDHEASGAGGFTDMGENWVAVRKAAHDGTLRPSPEARDVAERWEQFTNYLCLGLSQDLGENVTVLRPRRQTTSMRLDEIVRMLTGEGRLEATLRVPGAIGDIDLRADLRTRQTLTRVSFAAPGEMRATPRINWLLRQLKEAPGDLRVDVAYPNARQTTAGLLLVVAEEPERLLYEPDIRREPRSFSLTLLRKMGQKRGKEEGSFVRETRNQIVDFYGDLVQNLKPWQARAPRLREVDLDEPAEVAQPDPPAFSQDETRDAGDALEPAVS